jgi:NADH:ubiquinone oxidoreductase subunit E/NAD-dependent dihydropyrimidine dehydrogenase PreA subunit/ferredoxin
MMFNLFGTHAVIDGRKVRARKGATILEAARQVGIEIPTLCHVQDHPPTGACRVCVVEVEGLRTLVGSCHTPLDEGMVIHTSTPKVLAVRRAVVELMLTAHTGECVNDTNADHCSLHNLASDHEVGAPRFSVRNARFYPSEETNPYVVRNLSKCILCRRCITACREIAAKKVLDMGYRGFASKIITGYDDALNTQECRNCGICIDYCPTGALSRPPDAVSRPAGKNTPGGKAPSPAPGRKDVLPVLKRELLKNSCLSRQAMTHVAGETGLSMSEVFGVSSFFTFLPREPGGENRIKICRCVPCDIKGAKTIIGGIRNAIGIAPGETSGDRRFSLELVNCIGACDCAPAMMINNELYGNLTQEKVAKILKSFE